MNQEQIAQSMESTTNDLADSPIRRKLQKACKSINSQTMAVQAYYFIGTDVTLSLPVFTRDPPDCGSVTYSIDRGTASAAIKKMDDPSIPQYGIFYISSLDLSDPLRKGERFYEHRVTATMTDSLSGLSGSINFGLIIADPCIMQHLVIMPLQSDVFPSEQFQY